MQQLPAGFLGKLRNISDIAAHPSADFSLPARSGFGGDARKIVSAYRYTSAKVTAVFMESCETSINCHCPPFFCFARIGAAIRTRTESGRRWRPQCGRRRLSPSAGGIPPLEESFRRRKRQTEPAIRPLFLRLRHFPAQKAPRRTSPAHHAHAVQKSRTRRLRTQIRQNAAGQCFWPAALFAFMLRRNRRWHRGSWAFCPAR